MTKLLPNTKSTRRAALRCLGALCPLLAVLALGLPAGAGRAQQQAAARIQRRVAVMGTQLSLEVVAANRALALAASEGALRSVEAVEARLSTWRASSELSRFNATPLGEAFTPSAALASDLTRALYWRDETRSAFTPTARALVEAWGLRRGGRRPSAEQLEAALAACAADAIEFELPARLVRLRDAAGIEEGGFGKGVALDEAAAALLSAGVQSAFLDFGGQALVVGESAPATVALADPARRQRGVLRLELQRGSSATSGNGERGIEVEGERLGHVLDPRTGQPAHDFGSLTVCAPNATDADCLSTGLYVLGPEAALLFAHERPGIDVVVLERGASGLRARATTGLRERLSSLLPELTIEWFEPLQDL